MDQSTLLLNIPLQGVWRFAKDWRVFMLTALLIIFLIALIASWTVRFTGRHSGWILSLIPISVFIYLISRTGQIIEGGELSEAVSWAPQLGIQLSLRMDGLSLLFGLIITGIGIPVVVYTGRYMEGNSRLGLFYTYLFLFMGSMLGTVLADNIIVLFVFWELTGISSYLLIGFNHENKTSRKSALQALLVTGLGGLALLVGFLLLGAAGSSYEIQDIMEKAANLQDHRFYVAILLLICAGAFTKSAQFPFHFWLPNAMVAPTPVSTYLHSATMVKAGIYLIARFHPVLGGTPTWIILISSVGAATTLLGAWLALHSTDLKRILAYSTLSVLGTLTLLLGLGNDAAIQAAMVILLAHALYKGALFLVAGSIDHATGQRDIRFLGGLASVMPPIAIGAGLAGLSMAGLLPAFGFIGKEIYYEAAGQEAFPYLFTAFVSSTLLVAVTGLVCLKPFLGNKTQAALGVHKTPFPLWIGPTVLGILGLLFGLFPGIVSRLLEAASTSVGTANISSTPITLWHGFNTTFFLSLFTVAAGSLLYAFRHFLRLPIRVKPFLPAISLSRVYDGLLLTLNRVAILQTRILQNGQLRIYLLTILGTTLLLVWAALHFRLPVIVPGSLDIRPHEAILVLLVLVGALVVIRSKSRLASVAGLGVVGYSIAAIFALFSAPDLAMTQFVVETLTVILLVLIFYRLPQFKAFSSKHTRWRDTLVALATGTTIALLLLFAETARSHHPISDYFARNSVPQAHGRNIVNVILVDFRALDTLGEISVLALAAIGVYALLKLRLEKPNMRNTHEAGESDPGTSGIDEDLRSQATSQGCKENTP